MAIERTFIQKGQGYGPTPVTITAKIGNVVVYSGTVPTLNQAPPVGGQSGPGPSTNLFSWTNDIEFSGQQDVEISVEGGLLLLSQTLANYTAGGGANVKPVPGDANTFRNFWYETIDGVTIGDPFTDEKIDGVPQIEHPEPSQLPGQWWWYLPAGSTFTARLNIAAGNVAA